ncbi:hypothetical protein HAX54_028637 [Datura stramonium]|uniref:Uncharacterized protein n=1 Tax=Datura stramonium TaxID=4076 RepID=A0ABS8S9N5_DATST|nr:hypothetical protein [Datura stramonium]
MVSDPSSTSPNVSKSPSSQEQSLPTANLASSSPSKTNPYSTVRPASPFPSQETTISIRPLASLPPRIEGNLSPIMNRDSPHESVPKSPSPKRSTLTNSASIYAASDDPPNNVSLSDSECGKDLVPIVALKKGAWKRILASGQEMRSGSKTSCVLALLLTHWLFGTLKVGQLPFPSPLFLNLRLNPSLRGSC